MEDIGIKVVILGSQGVGKTSLVTKYIHKSTGSGVQPTIGASYFPSKVVVNGITMNLQIWDTAGQEQFRSMAPMYYRNADAAILVFDLTDRDSFSEAQFWVSELQRNAEMHVSKFLVGNKSDLGTRSVTREEAEHYAQMIDAEYAETSSLQNNGMESVFNRIAEDVLSRYGKTSDLKYWGLKESPSSSARLGSTGKEDSIKLSGTFSGKKKDRDQNPCCM